MSSYKRWMLPLLVVWPEASRRNISICCHMWTASQVPSWTFETRSEFSAFLDGWSNSCNKMEFVKLLYRERLSASDAASSTLNSRNITRRKVEARSAMLHLWVWVIFERLTNKNVEFEMCVCDHKLFHLCLSSSSRL